MKTSKPGDPVLRIGRLSACKGILFQDSKKDTHPIYEAQAEVNGEVHDIALKIMQPRPTINECVANLVGRHLGLNVLDPFLVVCTPELMAAAGLNIKAKGIFFATRLTKLKTMNDNPEANRFDFWQTELKTKWFQETFVFDTLIGNEDRLMKNVFFTEQEGKDKFILLDHQICLLSLIWKPETLNNIKNKNGNNVLSQWLSLCPVKVLDEIMQTARDWQGCIKPDVLRPLAILAKFGLINMEDLATIYEFLAWRADNLPDLVMKQINLECSYPTGTW